MRTTGIVLSELQSVLTLLQPARVQKLWTTYHLMTQISGKRRGIMNHGAVRVSGPEEAQ